MKRSKLEIGSFFINFMGFYILVMSLLWIFATEIMFVSDFEVFTGTTYAQYLASPGNQIYAQIYIITKKLIGFIFLATGIFVLSISYKSYRKGEKWSWYALLIGGSIPWATFIIYKIFIGYYGGSMVVFVIGAVLLVVGLVFPAKEMLRKKSG
ncbi:MAG: hypothetical protein ACFE75_12010 [Candidatus Hodarchaeota archaeon]